MSKTKEKRETIVTPVGVMKYGWLTKPNVKFNENGVYSVDLVVSKEAAQPLCDKLTKMAEDFRAQSVKEDATVKGYELYVPFIEEEVDGEKTGNIVFKLKQNATFKHPKTGERQNVKINIFDSAKKPLVNPKIGRGTKLKAAFNPNFILMPPKKQGKITIPGTVGISTYLKAVQILDLVEYTGGGDAASYGFGAEDGYVDTQEATEPEAVGAGVGDDTVKGGDF